MRIVVEVQPIGAERKYILCEESRVHAFCVLLALFRCPGIALIILPCHLHDVTTMTLGPGRMCTPTVWFYGWRRDVARL